MVGKNWGGNPRPPDK